MTTGWTTNWPINWVGNSVKPSDPPLEDRHHYYISAMLSIGVLLPGIHDNTVLRLSHSAQGGSLLTNGRLILVRYGSNHFVS